MNILGIDIGGSGVKGAIVDTKTGHLRSDRHRIATPSPSTPKAVAKVIREIKDHFEWDNDIGCCFPSVVINGKAKYNSNLDPKWVGVHIDELFSEYCDDLNISAINDADAAGIAEMNFGVGKGKDGLGIMLTIGTGIGSGMFYNQKLIPNTELGRIFGHDGDIFEKYAADSARKKEKLEWDEWGERFHNYLSHLVRIFSPDFFILGGGASKKIHKFKDQLKVETPIYISESLNNAGIIGAALNVVKPQILKGNGG